MASYNATDVDNWTDNSNWGSANPVGDWYGVTVTKNKVSYLNLSNNYLVSENGAGLYFVIFETKVKLLQLR